MEKKLRLLTWQDGRRPYYACVRSATCFASEFHETHSETFAGDCKESIVAYESYP